MLFLHGIFIIEKYILIKSRSLYTNLVPNNYINNKRLLLRLKNREFTLNN